MVQLQRESESKKLIKLKLKKRLLINDRGKEKKSYILRKEKMGKFYRDGGSDNWVNCGEKGKTLKENK